MFRDKRGIMSVILLAITMLAGLVTLFSVDPTSAKFSPSLIPNGVKENLSNVLLEQNTTHPQTIITTTLLLNETSAPTNLSTEWKLKPSTYD